MTTKHVVGFSGGADSQAVARLVRHQVGDEDVILLNTLAGGHEHQVTKDWIADYSRNIFPVTTVTPLIKDLGDVGNKSEKIARRRAEFSEDDELTFERLSYIKLMFPLKKAHFCTEYLKLAPQRRWCFEQLRDQGIDYVRYTGVRRDESKRRANTPGSEWDNYFDCQLYHPIATWTKKEVFDYLKKNGEEPNPLYKMGFDRVGCGPCVDADKEDVRITAARFPEAIDKIERWEKEHDRPFLPGRVPGNPNAGIREVVEWSRTVRGGRQYDLPVIEMEAENKTCSSKYGLCE